MATVTEYPQSAASRYQLIVTAQGLLSETAPVNIYGSDTTLTSQRVVGSLVGLAAGDQPAGILVRNAQAAVGTAPTTVRVGLADKTGKMLVLSGNLNNATNFPAGPCALPFTAPYTVTASDGYFACIVVNGSWSVTQPSLLRANGGETVALGAYSTFSPPSFLWSGQTDLPAVGASLTISTAGALPGIYVAVY